jgi:hypothetical protein
MENVIVNVFTCCNGIYKDFIPLFILSNLYYNDECFVEIGVDIVNYKPIQTSICMLKQKYPNRFLIREVDFNGKTLDGKHYETIPNTVRFYSEPIVKSKYVYISDIDIIVMEPKFHEIHIQNMSNNNQPYSNMVRKIKDKKTNQKKLSGLHFTPYENYYPIPDFTDLIKQGYLSLDEVFLHKLIGKKYPNFNEELTYRPVHGIHTSLNRNPNDKLGWELPPWKNQWDEFSNSKYFKRIEPTFADSIKNIIKIINDSYK